MGRYPKNVGRRDERSFASTLGREIPWKSSRPWREACITQRIHIGIETAQARPKAGRITDKASRSRDTLLGNSWTSIPIKY